MLTRRLFITSLAAATAASALPARADEPVASWAGTLIGAARSQIGVTTIYDPAYVALGFPNGDPPPERGVCTDVVIRAYRKAFGYDLQQAVHSDMKRAFSAYPTRWGLKRPDRNIDHRRVPNLQTFWRRKGAEMPLPVKQDEWQPGDIATMLLPGALPHVGIVSGERDAHGKRLAIHNIGAGTQSEAVLDQFEITGRYRFPPTLF